MTGFFPVTKPVMNVVPRGNRPAVSDAASTDERSSGMDIRPLALVDQYFGVSTVAMDAGEIPDWGSLGGPPRGNICNSRRSLRGSRRRRAAGGPRSEHGR